MPPLVLFKLSTLRATCISELLQKNEKYHIEYMSFRVSKSGIQCVLSPGHKYLAFLLAASGTYRPHNLLHTPNPVWRAGYQTLVVFAYPV